MTHTAFSFYCSAARQILTLISVIPHLSARYRIMASRYFYADLSLDLLVRPRLVNPRDNKFDYLYQDWAFLFRLREDFLGIIILIHLTEFNSKPRWEIEIKNFNPNNWPREVSVQSNYVGKLKHARFNLDKVIKILQWDGDVENEDQYWDPIAWVKSRLRELKVRDIMDDDARKMCYIWLDQVTDIYSHCERMLEELNRKVQTKTTARRHHGDKDETLSSPDMKDITTSNNKAFEAPLMTHLTLIP